MPLLPTVKDQEEYDMILDLLNGRQSESFLRKNRQAKKHTEEKITKFCIIENRLFYKVDSGNHRIVIPDSDENTMLEEAKKLHLDNHLGATKLEELCKKKFLTIKREIIRNVVSDCLACKQSRPLKKTAPFKNIIENKPRGRFQADCISLEKYSRKNFNYKYILSVIDVHSKFAWAFPLLSKNSIEISDIFRKLFMQEGPPQRLHTDNGLEFKNSELDKLCKEFNILRIYGSPRHPQTQGQVERWNQTITRLLQKHIFVQEGFNMTDKIWVDKLEKCTYDYNISVHSATNKSPFVLFKGHDGFNNFVQADTNTSDLHSNLKNSKVEGKGDISDELNHHCEEISLEDDELCFDSDEIVFNVRSSMKREISLEDDEIEVIIKEENNQCKSQEVMDTELNTHRNKYNSKMSKNKRETEILFEIGDQVIIKKNFDNNVKTKKYKFDSFYTGIYEVVGIEANNRLKVKQNETCQIVSKYNVEKIKKPN